MFYVQHDEPIPECILTINKWLRQDTNARRTIIIGIHISRSYTNDRETTAGVLALGCPTMCDSPADINRTYYRTQPNQARNQGTQEPSNQGTKQLT